MVAILDDRPAVATLTETDLPLPPGVAMPKNLDALPPAEIISNLDQQIALLQFQLERLQTLRWALADPGTMERLGLAMTHTWDEVIQKYAEKLNRAPDGAPPVPSASRGPTRFERILLYFRTQGNGWATTKQLAHALGVQETDLRDVLYKTHKDHFERKSNPEGRGKVFRLKGAGAKENGGLAE